MKYVLAFALGVFVCFIVMHTIDTSDRRDQARIVAGNSEPRASGIASSAPVTRSDMARDSNTSKKTSVTSAASPTGKGHSVDGPRRPASELIEDMITSMGDPVVGKPLLAPHQTLQGEAKDEPWSTDVETSLRNNLEGNLGTRFEYPMINCGKDLCEIEAATIANEGRFDNEDFQAALRSMGQEAWWSTMQLGHPTCAYKGASDGRELVVCFVMRGG